MSDHDSQARVPPRGDSETPNQSLFNAPEEKSSGSGLSGTFLIVAIALVVIGVMAYFALQPASHPAVGGEITSLQLTPLLNADAVVTEADIDGQVTLINCWSPQCPPCRAELPHIIDIYERYRQREGFRFLSVCFPMAQITDVESQLAQPAQDLLDGTSNPEVPVYIDPQGRLIGALQEAATRNGTSVDPGFGLPTTLLLDRDGKIADIWIGYQMGVESRIDQAIKSRLGS